MHLFSLCFFSLFSVSVLLFLTSIALDSSSGIYAVPVFSWHNFQILISFSPGTFSKILLLIKATCNILEIHFIAYLCSQAKFNTDKTITFY